MRISDWSSYVCSSDLKLQQVDGIGIHQVELAATFPLINPTGFQLGISYRCIRKSQFMTYQYFPGQIIQAQPANTRGRSEERREGKECVSTCRSRCEPSH